MISHSSTSLRAGHDFSCAIVICTTFASRVVPGGLWLSFFALQTFYLHIELKCKFQILPVTVQDNSRNPMIVTVMEV